MLLRARHAGDPGRRAGFTLAEVAVTIAIVGLALAWMLQTLSTSKMTAAYSRNLKLSRELALYTLGQIESGLFAEELDDQRLEGAYSDEGYPEFMFEAVIGEETLRPDMNDQRAFDNWLHERQQRERNAKDDEELAEQPYERVELRVTFPKIGDLPNEYVIERWLPWKQLHPDEEGDEAAGNTTPGGEGL